METRCAPCGRDLSRHAPIHPRIYSVAVGEYQWSANQTTKVDRVHFRASTEKVKNTANAHLRPANSYEIHATLGRDRAHQHRLAAPRWPAQQHTLWCAHAEMREPLAVHERPLDALAQARDRACESANVGEADRWRNDRVRAQCGWANGGERGSEVRRGKLRRVGRLRRI